MNDKFRRYFAGVSAAFWLLNVIIPATSYAASPNFEAGQEMGKSQSGKVAPSQGSMSFVPGHDPNAEYDAIGKQYQKSGRSSMADLGTIYDAGNKVRAESQTCQPGDEACEARKTISNQYRMDSPPNPYSNVAEGMRAGIAKDPLATLGIGLPAQNGGSVCAETTTDLPPSTMKSTCLNTEYKVVKTVSKLPTTTTIVEASPYCIDPTYTLEADGSACNKTVYSCPQGGLLYGNKCVLTQFQQANCPAGQEIIRTSANFCPRCKDPWIVTQFVCGSNNDTILENIWTSKTQNGSVFQAIATNVQFRGSMGKSFGNTFVSNVGNGCNFPFYASQTCDSVGCTIYSKLIGSTCRAKDFSSGSYFELNRFKTCPSGYEKSVNDTCVREYPATATFLEATPGCLGGAVLTRSDPMVTISCKKLLGGSWQDLDSKSLTTGDVLNQHKDFALNCAFSGTETNQYIGLDGKSSAIGLLVDRIKITPTDGSAIRIIEAEERTAANGAVLNKVSDAEAFNKFSNLTPKATTGRAWGLHASDIGMTRYTNVPAVVSIRLKTDGINQQTGTAPGEVHCSSQSYSCPAGMTMNGSVCEDPLRPEYAQSSNCVNLGVDPNTETEGFYCTEGNLNECLEMPAECTVSGEDCIQYDEVPNSPGFGKCLASERTYDCPVPGETMTTQTCGYEPMCMNGNCFTPPDGQCEGVIEEVTQSRVESCFESREQTIEKCSTEITKDAYGRNPTAKPGASCASLISNTECVQLPIVQDEEGNYPPEVGYSCLGAVQNSCGSIISDPQCDAGSAVKSCADYESIDGTNNGRCVLNQIDYKCTSTMSVPGDDCTMDLVKVLGSLEAGREMARYMDPNSLRMFKGERSRCDRRKASFGGMSFGSKSCCNVDTPSPKNNNDVINGAGSQVAMQFVNYGASKASSYMYDFMMNSDSYYNAAMEAWGAGAISDSMAADAVSTAGVSDTFYKVNPSISYAGLGVAYAGSATTAVAGTTVSGGLTATSSYGLGGGFQLQFSPIGFYVFVAMQVYQAYQAALACDDEDYQTSMKSQAGVCYNTRTYCASKDCGLFGCTCVKYRTQKCCFNSKLAKIIHQQGKAQMGITGAADTCSGFSPEEMQKLDWSKIDMTAFTAEMLREAQKGLPTAGNLNTVTDKIKGQVNPEKQTLDKIDPYRP